MPTEPYDQHRDEDQPTQAIALPAPARVDPVIGGRYRLEELVGRGGTAEVWAATDTALERRVALKLVTASGGENASRVADEARLLARLNHPGLVPVYDAGTDGSGRPWVVMEFVDGETLSQVIRRGPVTPLEVATMGRALGEALHHVHEQGLIHRDVKPANVLVGRDGRVRLTDFGIARLIDAAKVTATGFTIGTASYLSPEQVTGKPVGPPSDVYSLGLVLLECLTGEREYAGTAVETAMARLHRQPRVPDGLLGGLSQLLRAMVASEAQDRPTAQQLARDLAAIAAGGQVRHRPATPQPVDRTQVFDRAALIPPALVPTPGEPPAPVDVRPAPRRSRRRLVLVALGLTAALAVVVALALPRSSDPTGPPVRVDSSVPSQLRDDVQRLQDEVLR